MMTEEQEEIAEIKKRKIGLSPHGLIGKFIEQQIVPFFETFLVKFGLFLEDSKERMSTTIANFEYIKPILGIILGFILLLFGSHLKVSFTMVQAFRQGGSARLFDNLEKLQLQMNEIIEANYLDSQLDEDNNGVADVLEISKKELLLRKIRVISKAIRPPLVQSALQGLWTSIVSATAAAKVEIARTVSLGLTFGDDINLFVQNDILITFLKFLSDEKEKEDFTKWFPSFINYICRFIGLIISFILWNKKMTLLTTTVRGGIVMIDNFKEVNIIRDFVIEYESIILGSLFVFGLFFQIVMQEEISQFIQIIFFPIFGIEHFFTFIASNVKSDTEKFQKAVSV